MKTTFKSYIWPFIWMGTCILLLTQLFACMEPEDIQPKADGPVAIQYHVSFSTPGPKRVLATLINSDRAGLAYDSIILDTVVLKPCVITMYKYTAIYAWVELEIFAVNHYDYMKAGVSYDGDSILDLIHYNLCPVKYMNIPLQLVATK